MNNSVPNQNSDLIWTLKTYVVMSALLTERVFIICSNALLLAVLLYHRALRERKQYILVAGMAVCDLLYGLGGILSNIQQIHEHVTAFAYRSRIMESECPRQLKLFVQVAMLAQQLMLLAQSADRLLAIGKPIYYFKLTKRFTYKLLISVYLCDLVYYLLAQLSTIDRPDRIVNTCSGVVLPGFVWALFLFLCVGSAFLAVVSQFCVFVIYKRKHSAGSSQAEQKRHWRVQRRLAMTVLIACVFAILSTIIPGAIIAPIVLKFKLLEGGMGTLILLFYGISPVANIAIYAKRQQEVRVGLKLLFARQQLPMNFEDSFVMTKSVKGSSVARRNTKNKVHPVEVEPQG